MVVVAAVAILLLLLPESTVVVISILLLVSILLLLLTVSAVVTLCRVVGKVCGPVVCNVYSCVEDNVCTSASAVFTDTCVIVSCSVWCVETVLDKPAVFQCNKNTINLKLKPQIQKNNA